jgi:predicted nucleic acid-binding protein
VIAVSDTGPLNYLILTESIHVLPVLFGEVYAPPAVVAELKRSKRRELEPVRQWASSPPRWLTVKGPAVIDQTLSLKLGKGEIEAISLAQELDADKTLLDDRDARVAARERQLEVVGTLGILEEAAKRRLIDIEEKNRGTQKVHVPCKRDTLSVRPHSRQGTPTRPRRRDD